MDIITFKSGETYPISFPFDAMVDLMGDSSIFEYLARYRSIKHQIEVLGTGMRYGHLRKGEEFKLTDKKIKELSQQNPTIMRDVWVVYDKEVAKFLEVYFEKPKKDEEQPEEEPEELTKEEKAENKKRVKR